VSAMPLLAFELRDLFALGVDSILVSDIVLAGSGCVVDAFVETARVDRLPEAVLELDDARFKCPGHACRTPQPPDGSSTRTW
jgi:hypothetical protein